MTNASTPVATDYLTDPARVDRSFWFDSRAYTFELEGFRVVNSQLAQSPGTYPKQYRRYDIFLLNGDLVGTQLSRPDLAQCQAMTSRWRRATGKQEGKK